MKKRNTKINHKNKPLFIVTLISFLIIILLLIYIIYLRFIPYTTLEYDGYAVSGKEIATNLLNTNFNFFEVNALRKTKIPYMRI